MQLFTLPVTSFILIVFQDPTKLLLVLSWQGTGFVPTYTWRKQQSVFFIPHHLAKAPKEPGKQKASERKTSSLLWL